MAGWQGRDPVLGPRSAAGLVAGLLAALVMLAVPAISSARLIEAPQDGAKATGSTKVVVNVGRGSVYARLNGVRVKRYFRRTAPDQRTVRVGAAEGLKPGRNVLEVRREVTGGNTTRARVVFTVKADGKLAGIASRGDHIAGAPVRLRAYGESKRTWCLVTAPHRSDLKPGPCPQRRAGGKVQPSNRAAAAESSGFGDLNARRTSFTPDVKGTYRVGLTSGSGSAATTDLYTVMAGPDTPLVPLDIPTEGWDENETTTGITVGSSLYRADTDFRPSPGNTYEYGLLQIVVLDRSTLVMRSNTTYVCNTIVPNVSCDSQVAAQVEKDLPAGPTSDSNLVLVSALEPALASGPSIGPLTFAALGPIGFDPKAVPPPPAGSAGFPVFAAVGVPKMTPGSAWVLADPVGTGPSPHLTGALTRDTSTSTPTYRPTPTDYLPLVVRSEGGTLNENTMTIANDTTTYTAEEGTGGFQIVLVDGITGEVEAIEFAKTNPYSASSVQDALAGINSQIAYDVDGASPFEGPEVVLVASVGDVSGMTPERIAGDWNDLASFVQRHGGTAHSLLSTTEFGVQNGGYAMAGVANSGPAQGFESGPGAMPPGATGSPGQLVGRLTRNDDDWHLKPGVADVTDPGIDIMRALYAPTQAWPEPDAVMCYIASYLNSPTNPTTDGLYGDDVRQAYWTKQFDGSWQELQLVTIPSIPFPAGGDPGAGCPGDAPFLETELDSLKGELANEIGQLIYAHAYLGDLSDPFAKNAGLSSWLAVNDVVSKAESVMNPDSGSVDASWTTILADVLGFGGAFIPELAFFSATFQATADLATLDQSGTPASEDDFETSAADLPGDIQDRITAMAGSYDTMFKIVAADPGKLRAFGTTSTGPPGGEWTADMQARTGVGIEAWAIRQAWQTLMPKVSGTTALLGSYPAGQAEDITQWTCSYYDQYGRQFNKRPFANLPQGGQVQMLSSMGPQGPNHDPWAISSWGEGNVGEPEPSVPNATVINPLFSPYDPDKTPDAPGQGLSFVPAHFFWELDSTPTNPLADSNYQPPNAKTDNYCVFP